MKKHRYRLTAAVLSAVMVLSLAACGGGRGQETTASSETAGTEAETSQEQETETSSEIRETSSQETSSQEASAQETPGAEGGRVLVAYFSWSGNTEEMASYIAEQTGGELLESQPETPYPTDYDECGDVALAERDNNERPAIANLPDSLEGYDTVLIGYPIWWPHDHRHFFGEL